MLVMLMDKMQTDNDNIIKYLVLDILIISLKIVEANFPEILNKAIILNGILVTLSVNNYL